LTVLCQFEIQGVTQCVRIETCLPFGLISHNSITITENKSCTGSLPELVAVLLVVVTVVLVMLVVQKVSAAAMGLTKVVILVVMLVTERAAAVPPLPELQPSR
jgi:hypothetical protein